MPGCPWEEDKEARMDEYLDDLGDTKFFKKLNSVTARPTGYAVMRGDDLIYMTNALIGNFREFMNKNGYANAFCVPTKS